jgi:hypothetical protein
MTRTKCTCKEDAVEIWNEKEKRWIHCYCPECEEELQQMVEEAQRVQELALRTLVDRDIIR